MKILIFFLVLFFFSSNAFAAISCDGTDCIEIIVVASGFSDGNQYVLGDSFVGDFNSGQAGFLFNVPAGVVVAPVLSNPTPSDDVVGIEVNPHFIVSVVSSESVTCIAKLFRDGNEFLDYNFVSSTGKCDVNISLDNLSNGRVIFQALNSGGLSNVVTTGFYVRNDAGSPSGGTGFVGFLYDFNVSPSFLVSGTVFPDSQIVFRNLAVSNRGVNALDLNVLFVCNSDYCARDWCEMTVGSEHFSLGVGGSYEIQLGCRVSSKARMGQDYNFDVVFFNEFVSKKVLVSIIVGNNLGVSSMLVFEDFGDWLKNFFGYGVVCWDSFEKNCLLNFGGRGLDFGGRKIGKIDFSFLILCITIAFGFLSGKKIFIWAGLLFWLLTLVW